MTETLNHAWTLYAVGIAALALAAFQLWSGKSIVKGPRIINRAKDPTSYWLNVVLTCGIGAFFVYEALAKLTATNGSTFVVLPGILAISGVAVLAGISIRKNREERVELKKPIAFSPAATTDAETSISVRGWSKPELDCILTDFLNDSDLRDTLTAHVNRLSNGVLIITFAPPLAHTPAITPANFLFLVNYLRYPKHFNLEGRQIGVMGRITVTSEFDYAEPALWGQRAAIYVPADDTDYDLVYAKLDSAGAYRIQFGNMAWKPVTDARLPAAIAGL